MPAWTPRPGRRWMTSPTTSISLEQATIHDGAAPEVAVRHLYLSVDTALHARVEQQVASAAGMKIAPWLRAMVRQITLTDFPASWRRNALRNGPTIPTPIAHALCCGWIRPHRPSFSNSSATLGPRKPPSFASSSYKRPRKIFRPVGRCGHTRVVHDRRGRLAQTPIRRPGHDTPRWA